MVGLDDPEHDTFPIAFLYVRTDRRLSAAQLDNSGTPLYHRSLSQGRPGQRLTVLLGPRDALHANRRPAQAPTGHRRSRQEVLNETDCEQGRAVLDDLVPHLESFG